MVNPQIENGHLDLSLEIVEKLCSYRISGEESQVLWVIWRKTYGWHKKEDAISLSQFCSLTGMKKPNIIRALNKLIVKNIIIKKDNEIANIYTFNKHFDTWKLLSKKITLSKKIMTVIKKDNKSLSKKIHTNENCTKETITKETASYACEKLNPLINLFKGVNPNYERLFGNKTQRDALDRLVKKFTHEKIENLLKALPGIVCQTYAPKITTPYELERDMGRLLLFVKGSQNKNLKNQVYKV